LAAFTEDRLLRFQAEAIIGDGDKILHAFRHAGFGVPSVDQSSPLPAANHDTRSLKAVQLPLDGIKGGSKISGCRPTISLTVVMKVQEHRLTRPTPKQIR
jgi:hypothetical protein